MASPVYAFDICEYFTPCQNFPDIGTLISVLLPNVIVFAGVILLFFILGGGVMIILGAGSGNSEQMNKGKQAFVASVAGFILIFSAYLIILLIQLITGIDIFNPPF